MTLQPTQLSITRDGLLAIVWNDGRRQVYDVAELRRECPCATCRDPATPASDFPAGSVRIAQMDPVGNYAYRIRFSDGHDTGIFTLEYLRELGRDAEG
jgi:DUF971 family protein